MSLKEKVFVSYFYDENSPFFADFYQLYYRIISSDKTRRLKTIMITSAIEGEGKSTLASFISYTAALSTQDYYLLIDGDMRRPSLHKIFNLQREHGLSDVLLTNRALINMIKKTSNRKLHLITAGVQVKNPFQLLNLEKTKEILNRLQNYYRMIIVDGPPLLPVSDALRFAQIVDGVILVIRTGKTPKTVVKRATDLLKQSGCNLIGVALNDMGEVLPYYYQKKYYRYQYEMNS